MKRNIRNLYPLLILTVLWTVLTNGCKKEDANIDPQKPKVITAEVSGISYTTAKCGGTVTSVGGYISKKGVCWSTNQNPTIADRKTDHDKGIGVFTSDISDLEQGTTYYLRAYASYLVIKAGKEPTENTEYGADISFKTAAVVLPTISTKSVSNITSTSAFSGGIITSDGGSNILARGVCWSMTSNPTIALNTKTIDGNGKGDFSSKITGLQAKATYYVRAYATINLATGYGNQVSFTTSDGGSDGTFDYDGRKYAYKTIGTQTWMIENLAFLPSVSPSASGSDTSPYYYVYEYQSNSVSEAKTTTNYITFGVLYNWEAAKTACPSGWHLPTDVEWKTLTDYLTNNGYGYGSSGSDIGKSMASTYGWTTSSIAGTIGNDQGSNNRSGFTALPGGGRYDNGGFGIPDGYARFWSSSEIGASAWYRYLQYNFDGVGRDNTYRRLGFSVRCVKNN